MECGKSEKSGEQGRAGERCWCLINDVNSQNILREKLFCTTDTEQCTQLVCPLGPRL